MFDLIKFWKKKDTRQSEFLISLGVAQGKILIASTIIDDRIELMLVPIRDAISICKDIFSEESTVLKNLLKYCEQKKEELF